jgi:hypothetical protein
LGFASPYGKGLPRRAASRSAGARVTTAGRKPKRASIAAPIPAEIAAESLAVERNRQLPLWI